MQENFKTALEYVLAHEGGFVNHALDPGGATNRGVTQATYDGYRASIGLAGQSVRHITEGEVADIYKRQYWDVVKGDDLPAGVDYAVFDYGVNSGPKRAAKALQGVVGASVDGWIGQGTIAAVKAMDELEVIEALCEQRMAFVRRLKTFKTFGRGWTSRIMGAESGAQDGDTGVIDRAFALAKKEAPLAPPPVAYAGKADGDVKTIEKVKEAVQDPKTVGGALSGAAVVQVVSAAPKVIEGVNSLSVQAMVFTGFLVVFAGWFGLKAWREYNGR